MSVSNLKLEFKFTVNHQNTLGFRGRIEKMAKNFHNSDIFQ